MLGCSFAIATKVRPAHELALAAEVIGDVNGKIAILEDDMIVTGGTLLAATDALFAAGATAVHAFATHPLFVPPLREPIRDQRQHNLPMRVIGHRADRTEAINGLHQPQPVRQPRHHRQRARSPNHELPLVLHTQPFAAAARVPTRYVRKTGLGVAADEQHGGDRDRQRRVAAEERESRPRREAVRAVGEREDRASGRVRQPGRDRVVPARGEDVQERTSRRTGSTRRGSTGSGPC
jgi:hypothetical protein